MSLTATLALALAAGLPAAAGAQACMPSPSGLMSWWPGDGNADDVASTNHGTLHGAGFAPGRVGDAFSFDGSGAYVSVPASADIGMTGAYTLEAWVEDTGSSSDYRVIAIRGSDSANDIDIYIQRSSNDLIVAHNRRNGGSTGYVGFLDPPHGRFFHLVVTFDGTEVRAYYDGLAAPVVQGTGRVPAPIFTGSGWEFGRTLHRDFNGYGRFRGRIDEIALFDRALSPQEIGDLARAHAGRCHDSDGDGVADHEDTCPGGDDNLDADADGVADACDACPYDAENDADGDGVCGDVDVCTGGNDYENADADSLPDLCDACPLDPENDADGDGLCESDDNCAQVANSDQSDLDDDGEGDACDADDDGDGMADDVDLCPFDADPDQADFDGDGAGDVCDSDHDGDGVLDAEDACVPTPVDDVVNAGGCAIAELCPCDATWKNHGAYARCVSHTAEDFVSEGVITDAEKDEIVSSAAGSTCGHKRK